MRALMRLLLLCLIAVAVPLQGFAATGAVHCAPMHDRMEAAMADHHGDRRPDHHHQPVAADHALAEHDATASQSGVGTFKCSACAACCVAMGLPAGAIALPQAPADGPLAALTSPPDVAFLTGGPERPPRPVLA
jgi:hypothetical protein